MNELAEQFNKTQGPAAAESRDRPTGGMTVDQHVAIAEHASLGGAPVKVMNGDIVYAETQPGTPPPPPPPAYKPPRAPRGH